MRGFLMPQIARAQHTARPLGLLAALCLLGVFCLLLVSSRVEASGVVPSRVDATAVRPSSMEEPTMGPNVTRPADLIHPFKEPDLSDPENTTAPQRSVCDLPEFQPGSLHLNVSVYVFAWRRMASLKRTIESLQRAEYCGRYLPLRIHIDGGARPEVIEYIRSVEWVQGEKTVVSYHDLGLSLGIRGMWTRAVQSLRPNEHVLPLEDDIEVSPLYYWWLLRAAREYGDLNDPQLIKARRLVGISLYTPRLNEISYPQTKWLPSQATSSPVFLLQVPCSWGALFVGSAWAEFINFYQIRTKAPFFNFSQEWEQRGIGKDREPLGDPRLFIPYARSNVWPRSWKRFMIDFMFGRGYVMLYPNLPHQTAFSTTYMERGGHSAKDGKEEAIEMGSLRRDVDPLKTVKLQSLDRLESVTQRLRELPAYHMIPTFDVYHHRRQLDELVSRGFTFTEHVRWWGAFRAKAEEQPEYLNQYSALASAWTGSSLHDKGAAGGCALDMLLRTPGIAPSHVVTTSERYVVFQPPGGLGEWFIALRNAVGVARTLRRTLVIPHMMWGGGSNTPVDFSSVFSLEPLRQVFPNVIEMKEFLRLGIEPSRLVLLRGKDPLALPSRAYFDKVARWEGVGSVSLSAQNAYSLDYRRLYGGCDDAVLAFSQMYAAFDGFETAEQQEWLDWTVLPALLSDSLEVERKAAVLIDLLQKRTGGYTCVHLADLDAATITSPGALPGDSEPDPLGGVDIAEPSATSKRRDVGSCESYDSESLQPNSRVWVRELSDSGAACALDDDTLVFNFKTLPQDDPFFVVADGERVLPSAERLALLMRTSFSNVTKIVAASNLEVAPLEWPALEMHVCARASTLLLNHYSPLSAILQRRAAFQALRLAQKLPTELSWRRLDSHNCLPIFTKTARFDVVPNRFGVLGQFGPDRKLQLLTTNVSTLIGSNGKFFPNASIELEVFISNASHPLSSFEYTKVCALPIAPLFGRSFPSDWLRTSQLNNHHGITVNVPRPAGGWQKRTWYSLVLPISDRHYSFPMSTPWDLMDRLELYYGNQNPHQPRGDYIRVRHIYLRSTRSYMRNEDESQTAYTSCHDLALLSRRPFSDVSNIKRKRLVLEGPATMLINRRVFPFGCGSRRRGWGFEVVNSVRRCWRTCVK
ncbi:MAG: hypothetical protein SGPRY_000993 [Prymnesium sp.]